MTIIGRAWKHWRGLPWSRRLSPKTFLPRSLFGRSLLILVVPIILIQVISSAVFFDRHWSRMTTRLAYGVAGEVAIIAASIEERPEEDNIHRVSYFALHKLGLIVTYTPDAMLGDAARIPPSILWESLVAERFKQELNNLLGGRAFTLSVDFEEKWLHVYVQLNNGLLEITVPQRRLFSSSGYVFLLWMVGVSLILLTVAIMFMRNQIRPIRRLAVAAERMGKGRDVMTFKPEGAREVRQAAQAFLDMQRRIRRQIEQRTAMLAGVSHDLRTPLTRLKLQLSLLPSSPDIEAMKDDISQMEKMIAGYLDFVRGEGDEPFTMTDMADFISRAVHSAEREGLSVEIGALEACNMMIKPLALERALSNILSNAAKYAETARVSSCIEDERLEITVEDDGPGIAPDLYEDVFKPFFRVDSSRNSQTGGVGLGMPIAMDIIHAHGGKIWLEKGPWRGGLCVKIRLPF